MDYGDLRHYVKPIMRILLKDYGKDVWALVSDAIKTANPTNEYRLSQLFSKEDSFSKKQTSVLAELSEEILHDWCRTEPDKAPLFIAHSTDVYIEDNDEYRISPRAQFLIDEFGENKKILSALSKNMGTFGWSGSVVPIYKKEVLALEPLLKHKHQSVREWADSRIAYLNKAIERESMLDEEMEWGIR